MRGINLNSVCGTCHTSPSNTSHASPAEHSCRECCAAACSVGFSGNDGSASQSGSCGSSSSSGNNQQLLLIRSQANEIWKTPNNCTAIKVLAIIFAWPRCPMCLVHRFMVQDSHLLILLHRCFPDVSMPINTNIVFNLLSKSLNWMHRQLLLLHKSSF